jgi:hypothetical protein
LYIFSHPVQLSFLKSNKFPQKCLDPSPQHWRDYFVNIKLDIVGKHEEASQLVELLRVTGDLEEQGDILHYMAEQYGLAFKVLYSILLTLNKTEIIRG